MSVTYLLGTNESPSTISFYFDEHLIQDEVTLEL